MTNRFSGGDGFFVPLGQWGNGNHQGHLGILGIDHPFEFLAGDV